jgi:hypothetical protein
MTHTMPSYWFRWGSHEVFPWYWPWTVILPISASQVARCSGVSHQHLAMLRIIIFWLYFEQSFCVFSRLASNLRSSCLILPRAGIIGVCSHNQLCFITLYITCCSRWSSDKYISSPSYPRLQILLIAFCFIFLW